MSFDDFFSTIVNISEVGENIKSNYWLYYQYNNLLREKDLNTPGADWSFLIINAIKAVEYFLYEKIKTYFSNKNEDVKENTMLNSLIEKLNISMIKDEFKNEVDIQELKGKLKYIKDKCRNGYFHKHRIDNEETLIKNRFFTLQVFVEIVLLLK